MWNGCSHLHCIHILCLYVAGRMIAKACVHRHACKVGTPINLGVLRASDIAATRTQTNNKEGHVSDIDIGIDIYLQIP